MITWLNYVYRIPDQPTGLAYDSKSDVVFVSQPFVNNVIAVNVTTGTVVLTIGKGKGNGFGEFEFPSGVALDSFGHLLVADQTNNRIAMFNASDGTPVSSFPMYTPTKPLFVFVNKNGSVIVGGKEGIRLFI